MVNMQQNEENKSSKFDSFGFQNKIFIPSGRFALVVLGFMTYQPF